MMIARAETETHEERLARIKQQVAGGTYETPEKLEAAIDAFLDQHDAAGHDLEAGPEEARREDGHSGPSQPR